MYSINLYNAHIPEYLTYLDHLSYFFNLKKEIVVSISLLPEFHMEKLVSALEALI